MLEDLHFLLLLCDFRDRRKGENWCAPYRVQSAATICWPFFNRSKIFFRPSPRHFFCVVWTRHKKNDGVHSASHGICNQNVITSKVVKFIFGACSGIIFYYRNAIRLQEAMYELLLRADILKVSFKKFIRRGRDERFKKNMRTSDICFQNIEHCVINCCADC